MGISPFDTFHIGSVTKSVQEQSQQTGTMPITGRSDENGDDILAYELNGFLTTP